MLVNAQEILECGSSGISPQQRQAFLTEIDSTSENAVVSGSIAANGIWKVGVWVYHLRRSDGTSNKQNPNPYQAIATMNGYFSGLFEFVVCGTTNIDNDEYFEVDLNWDLDDLWADIDALNESASDQCVRIFLLGGQKIFASGVPAYTGYGNDPLTTNYPGVFVTNLNADVWAHEMGHFFSLPHTFAGGPSKQYVHHPTVPLNYPVTINGNSYTCHQTGDGFCDTAADPGSCNFSSTCQQPSCTDLYDPLSQPYSPDPTLLMGYTFGCSNRFTLEQLQAMRMLYLWHPAYGFLKPPPAECISPAFGHIERNCEGILINNPSPINPMAYVPVEIRDDAAPYCNPQDNKTDLNGRYLTKPCPMTGSLRWSLPDRNYIANPYNGVTTFDMFLIRQHILEIKLFEDPFQMIAADVNNSGTITTFDIVQIQRLLLGYIPNFLVDPMFPNGISWRYVPKLYTGDPIFWNQFSINPFTATVVDPFTFITRSYSHTQFGLTVPNSVTWMDFVHLHTNSVYSSNEAAWSFTGIKLGDVNCNAAIEGDPFAGDDHEFLIDSSSLTSVGFTGTKRIRIVASSPREVVAWQFGARYTSDSLTVSNLAAGTDAELFNEENFSIAPGGYLNAPGHLCAIWYAEDGEPVSIHNKALFEFNVTTSQGAVNLTNALQLDKTVLPFFFYDKDGELIPNVSLTLHLSEVPQGLHRPTLPGTSPRAPQSLRAMAYPMPFRSEVVVSFELPHEGPAQLDVFDAAGKLVGSSHATFPAGLNEISVTDLARLPSGFYWYLLRAGDMTAQGKLGKR